jgi:hypothetical protein
MDQTAIFALIIAAICIVLIIVGIFGDSWDARERRADAWKRNHRGR